MTRKGAIAVYLEPWHQDIEDFLDIKKNSGEERRRAHDIFPALWIPDIFMERVEEDGDWTLFDPYDVPELKGTYGDEFKKSYLKYEQDVNIRKTVKKAKDIWRKTLTSYFEVGSPFLCFKDNANKANPNKHSGVIRSSNLCTEVFQNTSSNEYLVKMYVNEGKKYLLYKEEDMVLLKDGNKKLAKKITSLDTIIHDDKEYSIWCVEKEKIDGKTAVCNLASVNLSKIYTKEDMERVVPVAINMLDNVIDLNYYPLLKVKTTNMGTRSIGLGVMGEAEMLAVNKIMYGTQEHLDKIDNIMECLSYNAIKASSELGKLKGNYKEFEGSNWNKGIMPQDFSVVDSLNTSGKESSYTEEEWNTLRESCKFNMRNGYLMAIAPTSSISILVGTTQAIEPVYKRKWYEENLSGLIPVVVPKLNPDTWNYYIPAYEVNQIDLIKAGAVRQKWIDQGESLNIFMSLDKSSGKYLHEIYSLAWKLGLKSTYYLRSQSPEAKNDVEDRSMECTGCQ